MPEFALKDILPNPFRAIERYPINRDKIAALSESIEATGFWDNIVGREVGGGKVEQAYGHHRKVTLDEKFGLDHKINIITKPLTDEYMLKIMAHENMEEWGTSAVIEQETVRAVVEAYAEGKIELEAPSGNIRYYRIAPSFIPGLAERDSPSVYTATTVARFLGWLTPSGEAQEKVEYALGALELIEEGVLSESDFQGLSTKDAEAVVKQARRARSIEETKAKSAEKEAEQAEKEAEQAETPQERQRAQRKVKQRKEKATKARATGKKKAQAAGKAVSEGMKEGHGTRNAAKLADAALPAEETPPPDISRFTRRVATDIAKLLDPDGDRVHKLDELARHREHIPDFERHNLITVLRTLASRADAHAAQLAGEASVPKKRAALPKGGR